MAATGDALPTWEDIEKAAAAWTSKRQPRPDDVPLTLYRDANSWCPFCHRVWFFMEAKGLRYLTERIHLRGDPAEPPKQASYKRLVPSGAVPAIRIRDEVVPESLDILYRLEKEFPDPPMLAQGDEDYAAKLCELSMAFNCDDSRWLHNTRPEREASLREDTLARLEWLEGTLSARGGPFFLGQSVSLVDAAYVGFLTRIAHNFLYFKALDIRDPARFPHLDAWFKAMELLPAYQFTKQDAYFEQRIYQAHPDRRDGAEGCMRLGRPGSLVGEPDCRAQPGRLVAPRFDPAHEAAREAAARLAERRGPVLRFLERKVGRGDGKRGRDDAADEAAAESHLRGLAACLAGLVEPTSAASLVAGGTAALEAGPVARLGDLVGTPRDMSSAAAAQLRAALAAMLAAGPPAGAGAGAGAGGASRGGAAEWQAVD